MTAKITEDPTQPTPEERLKKVLEDTIHLNDKVASDELYNLVRIALDHYSSIGTLLYTLTREHDLLDNTIKQDLLARAINSTITMRSWLYMAQDNNLRQRSAIMTEGMTELWTDSDE
jgi:hypothetical protein